jgi:putative ABC transport system permease protein
MEREERENFTEYVDSVYRKILHTKGRRAARIWFWSQFIRSLPRLVIKSIDGDVVMLKNYVKIALRSIKMHKTHSIINIAGLAVGMACFILMMFYVYHELSFDKFHDKYDHLYRVIRRYSGIQGMPEQYIAATPAPLAPTMVAEFPEVVNGTRIGEVTGTFLYKNKVLSEDGIFADHHFFELFNFDLQKGSKETCLSQPFAMVITEELSKKYFGSEDPVGMTLNFSQQMNVRQSGSRNENYDVIITGVIGDVPKNSSLQFDYIISFVTIASIPGNQDLLEQWGRSSYYNYVELLPGTASESLQERLAEYSPRFRGRDPARYILQPMKDLHWMPISYMGVQSNMPGVIINDIKNLYLFSTIAFIILIIACINYMNLATSRFSQRTKEIGLRKVVGAQKSQLIKQFMGESLLFSIIAFLFAVLLVLLVLPAFSSLVDREIQIHWLSNPWITLTVFGMVLFAGLFSGSYPALFLSSLRPVTILKGSLERRPRRTSLRNALVVFQFAVSVFLIAGTLVAWQQLRFIKNKDIGYDREHVVIIPLRDELARKNGKILSDKLIQNDRIIAVSGSEYIPPELNNVHFITHTDESGKRASANVFTCEVGYEFFDVFRIQIIEGRNFSREFRTDEQEAVILNKTAVQSLGMKDPIGKVVDSQGHRVIGVIKDYHHASLYNKIEPMIFFLRPNAYAFLSVRIKPGDIPGTLGLLRQTVTEYSPHFAFEYYFQDDYFNEKYKSDQHFGRAFSYASALAIFIACLGVFGLISFSIERRTKEIAIRKVLGATVHSILGRLSNEFILLVAFANMLAWPVAYYFMNKWLQNFAFRINISIWTFFIAGVLSLAVAILVVSFKSLQAATANPVDSLRYE